MTVRSKNKSLDLVANHTDIFHMLVLTCLSLGSRYNISQLDSLALLRSIEVPLVNS